jgi:ATP-dependent helicase HrpB
MKLPILDLEERIVATLRKGRRLILSAPTASGKSTQLPQILLRHGFLERGQAAVLEPRRLAARMLAARVAQERGTPLGREVGYQVRFENVTGPETRIRFVTEGLLLRQMSLDPSLSGVAALVFDEFHERHLFGDVTLARALDLAESTRPDLLIVVMSATLDLEALQGFLAPCETLTSQGRTYSVEIRYAGGGAEPVWERAAEAVADWEEEGDALVFMPGAFEIARTIEAVRERVRGRRVVLPLHGELPPEEQDAAVARHSRPKVVVATNVAETSITIDGVRLVVDSGLARIPRYDPVRGINTLLVEKVSRASAEQRAGRAGRTAPGVCVRLWDERDQSGRALREEPEIRRVDMAETALTLLEAGVADLRRFRWLDAPKERALEDAYRLLVDLGAASEGRITELGRRMAAFPIHPRYARLLLAAQERGCVREAALIAALTQARDLLFRRVDDRTAEFREDRFGRRATSDFWVLVRAWEWAAEREFRVDECRRAGIHAQTARQVGAAFRQFLRIAEREGFDTRPRKPPDEALRRCVLTCFSDRVARRLDGGTLRCEMVHGRRGTLARESAVHDHPLFVAAEAREIGGKKIDTILSLATAVEVDWLRELAPREFLVERAVAYDAATKRVCAEERTAFRGLVLERRPVDPPPAAEAARLLAEEVVAGRLKLNSWDDAVEQWILRVNFLAAACPELEIAPIGPAERRLVVEGLCEGAYSHREIKDRPAMPAARGCLSPAKQALVDRHAPERVELPNGRRAKVTYAADGPPYLSARIQELYGVTRVPPLAMGRVAPQVRILAPNMRPVQITQDLAGFWREHYPKLRKELQRRYPKHEWREVGENRN